MVLVAEQLVDDALYVGNVLRVDANAAEEAKDCCGRVLSKRLIV